MKWANPVFRGATILVCCASLLAITTLTACDPDPGEVEGCTRGQGYWKNHPADWPLDPVTLGGVDYSKVDAIAHILETPSLGDGSMILAKQLIAAKLNVASRASANQLVAGAIEQAREARVIGFH